MILSHMLKVLRLRWLIIAGLAFAGLALAGPYALLAPDVYQSDASVVVETRSSETIGARTQGESLSPDYLLTLEDILKSNRVAERVVDLLDEESLPVLASRFGWVPGSTPVKPFLAKVLQPRMTVQSSLPSSRLMRIGYASSDPQFSALMANAFAQAFIDVNLALQTEPARAAVKSYNNQLTQKADELEAAQRRLASLKSQLGVIDSEGGSSADNVGLTTLATQLASAAANAEIASSQAASGALPALQSDPVITQLNVQLSALRSQLAQLNTIAGPNNAQVRQLRDQIASVESQKSQQIAQARRSKAAEAAQARQAQQGIANQVAAQMQRTMASQAAESELAQARLDVAGVQEAYDQMAQRRTQLEVLSQSAQTNISLLTPATPNFNPVGPRRLFIIVLGVLGGLIAGIAVAILLELLNLKIRMAEELDGWLGIPDLGSVRSSDGQNILPPRRFAGLLPSLGNT
ncbi:Wzz/FepE/Etk N-terminal domain-containing protein [Croceicoccus hydrothermalis]|uniref:Wzz/FepE/Etk N-terminal domain-containing protein n=1 Tax=Croceicoccus hydrothermalis TaxID=2867964 RepID=UPI001EFB52FE|nr:Wzz/FepE/Etk N-terminal domain-containing protein [Croceicoccus hydrothermalis]